MPDTFFSNSLNVFSFGIRELPLYEYLAPQQASFNHLDAVFYSFSHLMCGDVARQGSHSVVLDTSESAVFLLRRCHFFANFKPSPTYFGAGYTRIYSFC